MADGTGKRPFWMHQLVEYILGGALVATGMQSPQPLVPSVVGGVILLYAACTKGAVSAFRLIHRRVHRVFDPVLIGLELAAALQPWVDVRNDTRVVMVGIAVVHAVVWWGSSFEENVRLTRDEKVAARQQAAADAPAGDRSTELGKKAGRAVGTGVNMVRRARAKRES
ncbi:MAG: hypothetical protein Q7V57_02865 [Actinomycetota bacterium]|nr:hypothetical protein [Actinomycetota bacterium]